MNFLKIESKLSGNVLSIRVPEVRSIEQIKNPDFLELDKARGLFWRITFTGGQVRAFGDEMTFS